MIKDSKQANQNLYIRKLNGLGEKISVRDSLKVGELKEMVRCLKSLEAVGLGGRDFNLIYKGRNITQRSQQTLRQLNIPSDGIIHLVFSSQQQKKPLHSPSIKLTPPSCFVPSTLSLRVIFNNTQHKFLTSPSTSVLQLKKTIAIKLNLVYQSLTLSHLGTQMVDDLHISDYKLQSDTLISLRFNNAIQHPRLQMKKLQSRMVSSVTISDQNSQPNSQQHLQQSSNHNNLISNQFHLNHKLTASSNSFQSEDRDDGNDDRTVSRLSSMIMHSTKVNDNMYKSEITTFGNTQVASKAALMFKNALHQKIIQTQSVVSGQFSQSAASSTTTDPNTLLITVKNQQQTKQFVFECLRAHQILDIKEKLLHIQRHIPEDKKLEISLQEDLFQSIDLSKSGCVTLNEIVKKLGSERAVFVYRVV